MQITRRHRRIMILILLTIVVVAMVDITPEE